MPVAQPDQFDVFARLLSSGSSSPRQLIESMVPPPGLSAPLNRLLNAGRQISIRAAQGGWTLAQGQFIVVVRVESPLRYEVVLPPYYSSLKLAEAQIARTGHDSLFDLNRLASVIALLLDNLVRRELQLVLRIRAELGPVSHFKFVASMEDHCDDGEAVTLSRHKGYSNPLCPDPHYFHSDGYFAHKMSVLQQLTSWSQRSDLIVWRGSTTGSPFTAADPLTNERIKMAAVCKTRPDLFDVKLTGIVQAPSGTDELVRAALQQRGLLADWAPMDSLVNSKFALHIDGNAAAAGLMEKLSLGCCVLQVASSYEQWFEPRLTAWEHYVPIAGDLSDLVEKAEYLVRTPALAERIARNSLEFALANDPDLEARRLIDWIVKPATHELVLAAPGVEAGELPPGWQGVEYLPDGGPFRWTATNRVTWPIAADLSRVSRLRVTLPLTAELVPNFHAGCTIEFAGRTHRVKRVGGGLQAEFFLDGGEISDTIHLNTPQPATPVSFMGSDDPRPLGLAIKIA
jgi:hypothetical protein